jgi:hypothetical protein
MAAGVNGRMAKIGGPALQAITGRICVCQAPRRVLFWSSRPEAAGRRATTPSRAHLLFQVSCGATVPPLGALGPLSIHGHGVRLWVLWLSGLYGSQLLTRDIIYISAHRQGIQTE